jgi:hypothetical protein
MTISAQANMDEAETARPVGAPRALSAEKNPANPLALPTPPAAPAFQSSSGGRPGTSSTEDAPTEASQNHQSQTTSNSNTTVNALVVSQTRIPLGARRLTVHGTIAARPSLLTRQVQFKSSSAVPTLNTTSAVPLVIGSTASSRRPTGSTGVRPGSSDSASGSGFASSSSRRASMAGHDLSAADLLRQAMMHRQVTARFLSLLVCSRYYSMMIHRRMDAQPDITQRVLRIAACLT